MRRPASVKRYTRFCLFFTYNLLCRPTGGATIHARPSRVVLLPVPKLFTADRREAPPNPLVFFHRKVLIFLPLPTTLSCRPAGGALACSSFPIMPAIARFALLPFALCSELTPGAGWGPSCIGRVLPSIARTEALVFQRPVRSAAFSQSPGLGDWHLLPSCPEIYLRRFSALRFAALHVAVAQRFVYFTGHPQPVQQYPQLPRHRHDGPLLRAPPASCPIASGPYPGSAHSLRGVLPVPAASADNCRPLW